MNLTKGLPKEIDIRILDAASETLSEVRRAKTEAKRSLKVKAEKVVVAATSEHINLVNLVRSDLVEAGNIETLELVKQEGITPKVEVTLAEEE